MGADFLSTHHITYGLVPVADAFSGGVTSDVICLRDYKRCTFLVLTGAIEDAGISNLITVKACTDAAAGGATAMAFKHRELGWSTSDDTWGALTAAASTGYNFAAADPVANKMWLIEVTADEVAAALANADFVRLDIAETANKTVTAAVIVILSEPRYPGAVPQTAIA